MLDYKLGKPECSEFSEKLTEKKKKKPGTVLFLCVGASVVTIRLIIMELVENLVKSHGQMSYRLSLKVHVLDAHLNNFKENIGAYSEEQMERFHQDILNYEHRFQGVYN